MDLRAPLRGKLAERKARVAGVYAETKWRREHPLDTDTELLRPVEEWEKSDRDGTCGNGRRFFLGPPSEEYKRRYALIDWSK